jgi:glutaredoxin 3
VPQIEIYSKTSCPYCIRAARLLEAKGVAYATHVIDHGGPKRQEMVERSGGRTTVPQIFIDGRHLGGCDDLFALETAGRLDQLLGS